MGTSFDPTAILTSGALQQPPSGDGPASVPQSQADPIAELQQRADQVRQLAIDLVVAFRSQKLTNMMHDQHEAGSDYENLSILSSYSSRSPSKRGQGHHDNW